MARLVAEVVNKGYDETKQKSDSLTKSSGDLESQTKKTTASTVALSGAQKALGIVVAAATAAIVKSISDGRRFTRSISELSAITGAAGEDLRFLSDEARRLGADSEFSASQAAEAFKLIASAKPDLLENKEALAEVTEQTLLLATASSVDLATAAKTVGNSLNQFGEGADQAARFVNVLAAGARLGSSEVSATGDALRNAGVAARNAGLSFEQTNAAIQVFAANGIEAAQSGTALRSILIRLETQADKNLRPSVVGLNQALENLNDQQLDAEQQAKLFGREYSTLAGVLIENRERVDDLTVALTGTNTAAEQAATITDNLEGDWRQLQSSAEGAALAIFDSLNPALRQSTQFLSDVADATATYFNSLNEGTSENLIKQIINVREEVERLEAEYAKDSERFFLFESTRNNVLGKRTAQLEEQREILEDLERRYRVSEGLEFADDDARAEAAARRAAEEEAAAERIAQNERERIAAQEAAAEREAQIQAELLAKELERIALVEERRQEAIDREVEQIRRRLLTEDELRQENLERAQEAIENSSLLEEQRNELLLQLQQDYNAESIRIETERTDAIIEENERLQSKREEVANRQLRLEIEQARERRDIRNGFTSDLRSGLGEQSEIYKAAASVTATINTYEAATTAYASALKYLGPAGPIVAPIAAGAAITAGLANVAQIQQARATGGDVTQGTPTLVGELGPEPFIPAQNGRIISNSEFRSAMAGQNQGGGGGIVINNYSSANVTADEGPDGTTYVTIEDVDEFLTAQASNPDSDYNQAQDGLYNRQRRA